MADVVAMVASQRVAWGGWGLGLGVGGGARPEQPVAGVGAEDRDLDPAGGQDISVGVLDPADQPVEAQAAQVVGHLASAVVCSGQPGGQGTQALIG